MTEQEQNIKTKGLEPCESCGELIPSWWRVCPYCNLLRGIKDI